MLSHHRMRMHPVFIVCTLPDWTLIRLSMQWFPPAVSLLKNQSGAHRDICACVPAAHVYHPSPQALSTERKRLAGVQLCKSHLNVAFVINNLGACLPPFRFSSSPSITSNLCPDLCHLNSYAHRGKHTTRTLYFNLFFRLFQTHSSFFW